MRGGEGEGEEDDLSRTRGVAGASNRSAPGAHLSCGAPPLARAGVSPRAITCAPRTGPSVPEDRRDGCERAQRRVGAPRRLRRRGGARGPCSLTPAPGRRWPTRPTGTTKKPGTLASRPFRLCAGLGHCPPGVCPEDDHRLTQVRSRLTAVTVGLGAALAPTTAWAAHSGWTDTLVGFLVAAVAFLGTWGVPGVARAVATRAPPRGPVSARASAASSSAVTAPYDFGTTSGFPISPGRNAGAEQVRTTVRTRRRNVQASRA